MGINLSFLGFFDVCHRKGALNAPMAALGSQEIHGEGKALFSSARRLFRERYGILNYRDCDMNDKAEIKVDLNNPMEKKLAESAATVLDAGTLEHIFDIRQVFANIHEMVRPGGTIIHIAPLSWHDHGYFNFNPKLFKSVMEINKYSLVAEAFHFSNEEPRLYVTFNGKKRAFTDKVQALFLSDTIPSGALYMIAYKKTRQKGFTCPYDIQH